MTSAEPFNQFFTLNWNLIQMQTQGLTHAHSLLQPPFRGNCMNWILGHLTVNRNSLLLLLGEEPVLDADAVARYETESEPVVGNAVGVLTLEMTLDKLGRAQERIAARLQKISPEELATEIEAGARKLTMAQRIFGLYFHETYHVGQLELLRQLAGTDDKVV